MDQLGIEEELSFGEGDHFERMLSRDELAPYLKWGEPFLVRKVRYKEPHYVDSRKLLATAFMQKLDFNPAVLEKRVMLELLDILKRSGVYANWFGAGGIERQISVFDDMGVITLDFQVGQVQPSQYEDSEVIPFSGIFTKELPLVREVPAIRASIEMEFYNSKANAGKIIRILERNGYTR